MGRPSAILAAAFLALGGCSRAGVPDAASLPGSDPTAVSPFDWAHPAAALRLSAGEAARRIGSLEWSATVTWSASRAGNQTRAVESHRLRQLASGEFRLLDEIDPGTWPGAETGREVIFAGGMTYARSRYAPLRARPADHGRDARRYRDESFQLAGEVARLFGPTLSVTAQGATSLLGRAARRFALGIDRQAELPAPVPEGEKMDGDTRRRLDFLEGRVPLELQGEMLLDAETGVPLQVKMKGRLGERADPLVRADVELEARITALGSDVGPVPIPAQALPDERKPRGVAEALDRAGLGAHAPAAAAPQEEDGE